MVIIITMRNVRLRNETYEFRMAVPADCEDSVGKKEITQSLKTGDSSLADVLAKELTSEWKAKFKKIRAEGAEPPVVIAKTTNTVADFESKLNAHLKLHLGDYLVNQTEEELITSSEWCMNCISTLKDSTDDSTVDLSVELGITLPLPKQKSPGMTRRINKAVIDALARIRKEIDTEAGWKVSEKVEQGVLETIPKAAEPTAQPVSSQDQSETGIAEITKLMIKAKNTAKKNREMIENEVMYLQEWLGGKSDITQFTKSDLVDYIQNGLPYSPKNMRKKSEYDGKSLAECVAMVKKDPIKYVPISYRTCENRLVGLQSVFNYAKTQLALIKVNPAMGVSIPKVRISCKSIRSYTSDELDTMWAKLKEFSAVDYKYPERYWVTVLALYHGFRVNEICSLQLKNIYQDVDDVWVMDIKEDGVKKTVKTSSSVRIVPVHPFVLETLDFMGFAETRKRQGTKDDLLFPNLTYTDQGYAKKISAWFRLWKKTWLPVDCHHKNFHSLRHTFIQQAQNQAKMPDRYHQEIAGHAVSGMSAVHMGYSGRLKPKDVLVELSKVKYGWE
jgi:integrase